ncbi:hypothetical protein VIGAN_09177300 [Vigna angularis var. angularis]|uniref:Ribosomal protein L46 N-terminal domain-containing protein n=2 Tax=Phaseolus angularis TaxID=3914 RepID=A0A0S3T005_PHAAN|nr:hypothetical protein VIGAN_09177300 [Vigna angularis var. angularis]
MCQHHDSLKLTKTMIKVASDHMVVQPTEDQSGSTSYMRFFFKSQVIAKNKFNIAKCEDFVWVTKDELMEYFPEQAEFFNKMIIN